MSKLSSKIKEQLKVWVYYGLIKASEEVNTPITYSDINIVLIEILHDLRQRNPNETFKK
jgi:hypothetical protein